MVLFIHLDGVLHPTHCDPSQHFVNLPRLEAVLRQHHALQMAVAADREDEYSLDAVKGKFSGDVAKRIIGGTSAPAPKGEEQTRYHKIRLFLRRQGLPRDAWAALDDAEDEYPPHCRQLVLCRPEVGFDEDAECRLRTRLLGRV
jgi:HAD domain in Swiss Army Knife RNA repair proteins